jgi:hypothetical protein
VAPKSRFTIESLKQLKFAGSYHLNLNILLNHSSNSKERFRLFQLVSLLHSSKKEYFYHSITVAEVTNCSNEIKEKEYVSQFCIVATRIRNDNEQKRIQTDNLFLLFQQSRCYICVAGGRQEPDAFDSQCLGELGPRLH